MPIAVIPSQQDFADRRRKMLPPGQAWAWTTTGEKLLKSTAPEQIRFRSAINSLLMDMLPQTTVNLFQEWQASVGLPDACSDPNNLNEISEILLRLQSRGAESVEEFEALFPGSIVVEFHISYIDETEIDTELVDDPNWMHTWVLQVPEDIAEFIFAIIDEFEIDNPIEDFTETPLFLCRANQEFPAHQTVFIESIAS